MNDQVPVLIGVGIDTARYGHHATFLDSQLQHVGKPLEFAESADGYQRLQRSLQQLAKKRANAHFRIHMDAAGQYAQNLETFLRNLPWPKSISIGEPKRNKRYREAMFPKRKADPVDSAALARFAVREQPAESLPIPEEMTQLREVAGRLEAQSRQTTRLTNQLHNLLSRVFPEFALHVNNLSAGWLLEMLDKYPTPEQLARARFSTLTKLPHTREKTVKALHQAAKHSVASFRGAAAAQLVRMQVQSLRQSCVLEKNLLEILESVYTALPQANRIDTIPGIGMATAAILTAKMVSIDRFAEAKNVVGYFGVFTEEKGSGCEKDGRAKMQRDKFMSRQGNDLVRKYLWNAAKSSLRCNPATRALYRRLKARGTRGDVAIGHCMRKLLHLVYAIWRTGKPFDANHYRWEQTQEKAAGHNKEVSERQVVTAANESVADASDTVNRAKEQTTKTTSTTTQRSNTKHQPIDYKALRAQITLAEVLQHLGHLQHLKGSKQLRGACPIHHNDTDPRHNSFSVNLTKNAFRCFHPECGIGGNALDLWAAVHRLPLLQAAYHLAETFHLELIPITEKRNP